MSLKGAFIFLCYLKATRVSNRAGKGGMHGLTLQALSSICKNINLLVNVLRICCINYGAEVCNGCSNI